jgi:hypothetical protein
MSRKEYWGYSSLMIGVGGVLVFYYPPIAGVFLIGGGLLLLWSARLDRVYGKDRPTKKEIDAMSAEEYKSRLRDSRFRLWVDKGLGFKFPTGRDVNIS